MSAECALASELVEPGQLSVAVDQVGEGEWNEALSSFSDANLHQTWGYGTTCWGKHQCSRLVVRDGNEIVAAAQLRIVRIPVLGGGIAHLRWGPIWRRRGQPENPGILMVTAKSIVREFAGRRGFLLRVIPATFEQDANAQTVAEVWKSCGLSAVRAYPPYRTMRVDLTQPQERLRKNLDQKWRNQLNASERNGLLIHEGGQDALFERFLGIYDELMHRKQFETTVDPRVFRQIQGQLPEAQKMIILLAEKDGQLMAGLIASCFGDTGVYLLGATSDAGLKNKGSYLLQWRMMQVLKQRGCQWYDLGGVNPVRNPGVYHFKQGFGGTEVLQLGPLQVRGRAMSSVCVRMAEGARRVLKGLNMKN